MIDFQLKMRCGDAIYVRGQRLAINSDGRLNIYAADDSRVATIAPHYWLEVQGMGENDVRILEYEGYFVEKPDGTWNIEADLGG